MQRPSSESVVVVDAINRVLEAEREAAHAIVDNRKRCEAQLDAARAQRHSILERARQRAALVHSLAAAQVARAIRELESQSIHQATDREAFCKLTDEAVRALAERLTTDDAGPT